MNCRSCGGETGEIFTLGAMPLANSLLDDPNDHYKKYPLTLMLCRDCSLVQLSEIVPPSEMFVDYSYLTSCSPPMVEHAKVLVDKVRAQRTLNSKSLVMEIGSNDGYLLQHYKGVNVLGIDPSVRAAKNAEWLGVETRVEFFTASLAATLPRADVIHANNVLAHVPNLNDFVSGLAIALKEDGTIIIEVPYLCDLIDKTSFDTIYHEHVYYFSVVSLGLLLKRHGLHVNDVEYLPVHGGSLRLWIGRKCHPNVSVFQKFSRESRLVRSLDYYADFADRVEKCKRDTHNMLAGRRVAGFGAAAKATIFLNACGITSSQIACVADDTPSKQGKYIPGTGIPVVPTSVWLAGDYPATMILCWNFAHDVAHRYRTDYKGKLFTWYTGIGDLA